MLRLDQQVQHMRHSQTSSQTNLSVSVVTVFVIIMFTSFELSGLAFKLCTICVTGGEVVAQMISRRITQNSHIAFKSNLATMESTLLLNRDSHRLDWAHTPGLVAAQTWRCLTQRHLDSASPGLGRHCLTQ